MSDIHASIERLREAEQTLADYEREGKADGWVMSADLARATFDRLASLSAENAALKAKLAGVDEKGLEAGWRQYVTSQAREAGDHRTFTEEQWARVRQGNPPVYSRLRAAIAAYLAAVGGK